VAPPPPSSGVEAVVVTAEKRVSDARQLGDYKIYDLAEPTDLPADETKQVRFLDLHDVPFDRVYRYRVADDDAQETNPARLVLRLDNAAAAGMGKPLPAGLIALSEPGPDGTPVFIGQSAMRDTPVGLPFEIENGEVFSVLVQQTHVEDARIDANRT